MELTSRIISNLNYRRNRILQGEINCIPSPFVRFREDFPGVEQNRIYLVSGGTKSGKSMITNYLFVINTLMYCYYNPGKIVPKIFYFPLEEDKEAITIKVMAFVLFHITKGAIYISPTDLLSTNADKPLPKEVLDVMDSEEFISIMNLYESIVSFYDESNRIGIYKVMNDYAKTHGTIHYETYEVDEVNEYTGEITHITKEKFDYYKADNPNEYVICIVDHLSLLNQIKGEDLRLTISEFAKDCVKLRNRYNYTIVAVQQQNIESTGLDAFKANKVLPTVAGLSDKPNFM